MMAYLRKGNSEHKDQLIVCNFTPVIREIFKIGVTTAGKWKEVFNSDASKYGGSGVGNKKALTATDTPWHGKPYALEMIIPPLATIIFEPA